MLEDLLASLPPCTRQILALVAEGHSYVEIGERLGVSKQAVHKAASAAPNSRRELLVTQGFGGLASKNFRKQTNTQIEHRKRQESPRERHSDSGFWPLRRPNLSRCEMLGLE